MVEHANAFFTKESFLLYLEKVFVPDIKMRRWKHGNKRAFLIIDGFSGHFPGNIDELLEREDIVLLILPSHSSF